MDKNQENEKIITKEIISYWGLKNEINTPNNINDINSTFTNDGGYEYFSRIAALRVSKTTTELLKLNEEIANFENKNYYRLKINNPYKEISHEDVLGKQGISAFNEADLFPYIRSIGPRSAAILMEKAKNIKSELYDKIVEINNFWNTTYINGLQLASEKKYDNLILHLLYQLDIEVIIETCKNKIKESVPTNKIETELINNDLKQLNQIENYANNNLLHYDEYIDFEDRFLKRH